MRKSIDNLKSFFLKDKFLIISITSLFILIIDQISKWIVVSKMYLGESISLLKDILYLTYLQNTGAGFGILKGNVSLLIWFSIFVIGLIFYFYDQIPDYKYVYFAFGLILGGAFGNLIDRIRLGYVIDFINFEMLWPAFNIADSAITIGAILLIVYSIKNK